MTVLTKCELEEHSPMKRVQVLSFIKSEINKIINYNKNKILTRVKQSYSTLSLVDTKFKLAELAGLLTCLYSLNRLYIILVA